MMTEAEAKSKMLEMPRIQTRQVTVRPREMMQAHPSNWVLAIM